MKYFKFISLILLPILVGCSNEDDPLKGMDWDVVPAQVTIEVKDADGNLLFSDAYHGTLDCDNLSATISYIYDGKTLPMYDCKPKYSVNGKSPKSRYFMPTFYGVYVDYYSVEYPQIRFGEFDGVESHNETFAINWPDGTQSKIEFTSEARNPTGSMRIRVDGGEWVNSTSIVIVK